MKFQRSLLIDTTELLILRAILNRVQVTIINVVDEDLQSRISSMYVRVNDALNDSISLSHLLDDQADLFHIDSNFRVAGNLIVEEIV